MFLFGGTFFPIEVLPGWARVVALFLPLTHVASFTRGVCLGNLGPYLWIDLAYLAIGTPIPHRRLDRADAAKTHPLIRGPRATRVDSGG